MRGIQVTITFHVDDTASNEDIERIVWNAVTQIQDPADEDGNHAAFDTADVNHDILFDVEI
jgi:hypothetical protein